MIRVDKRETLLSHFSDSCLAFRNELSTICSDVLHWLRSVEFDFAFKCSCSTTDVEHFTFINDKMHQSSHQSLLVKATEIDSDFQKLKGKFALEKACRE